MRLLHACIATVVAGQSSVVTVDWAGAPVRLLKTTPTLQVVVNPLLMRDSPVAENLYSALTALGAKANIRFVPWLPYPRLGVAELEPPSGAALCGLRESNSTYFPIQLSCAGKGVIAGVDFAAYGVWAGSCGNLTVNGCVAPNSASAVAAACVGQVTCSVPPTDAFFGGGSICPGAAKGLAIQVHCSDPSAQHTYWDFTQLDPLMEDFMDATAGSGVIINFSTPPQWLYATDARVSYPDDPHVVAWRYEQGTELVDPTATAFGEYYGRLLAWYTDGGFTDEYGTFHASPYHYNISIWECLNEVTNEHGLTPEGYVLRYDAMVTAMRKFAPRGTANMKFMGLALSSYRDNYMTYFLNASNHAPGIPLDWVSWHHYASCGNRSDPATYEDFFPSVDGTSANVIATITARDALSPGTKIDLDELGVILPDDNDPKWTRDNPGFPPVFYNAAAGMYAYMFMQWSLLGVDVLGSSQYVGYPTLDDLEVPAGFLDPQFPSVSMTNWTTGEGNARYWILKLLLDTMTVGDAMPNTTVVGAPPAPASPFCGSVINLANLNLVCSDPGAVINNITFASYGTPTGQCGSYAVGSCNDANSTTIVESYCLGQNNCSVPATTPIFGDPCYKTVKYLVVEATCSSGGGFQPVASVNVSAQAFVSAADGSRMVLIINTKSVPNDVTVPGATGGTWLYVDESTGNGPYASEAVTADTWTLARFAVGVLRMP